MTEPKAKPKPKVIGQTNTSAPWQPVEIQPADVYAIKALVAGTATEAQQHRIVDWLQRATAVGEMSYRPLSDRDSVFAEGKRFIGLQFFTLAKAVMPTGKPQSSA